MATLTVTTTYDTAQVLTEAQLDAIKTSIETHFNTAQVEGSNIQTNILDGATYLADDSISTVKIINDAITTAKLVDSTPSTDTGITASKINTNAVTTAKITDLAVTTAKINDLAVTTAKIAANNVPRQIMLSNPTASATLADTTSSGTSETLVGTLSFTGLTSGKPNIIALQSTATTSGYGYLSGTITGVSRATNGYLILKKDGTTIHSWDIVHGMGLVDFSTSYLRVPLSGFVTIDIASSASHTYTLYIKSADSLDTLSINSAKLVGIQIV